MSKEDEILRILEDNARVSDEDIATMLDIPAEEISRIIKSMEERKIIRKYKAVINWEKFGREKVYAMIDVKIHPERDRGYDSIAERLMRFSEVRNLFLVSGMYDLFVLVEGDNIKEVAGFVAQKLAPLPQVTSTTTHFLLKKYKEDGDILFDREEAERQPISL
ncbi:MAG TPA: Lrp/AsnC family transcriptional regulator [Euryarchaeota archaeon]|nr:DNA-binding transcriptional regulator AsnC [archaeon BMS3Bbin15]HDL14864.1 Lrp/AsnC family transcriptional regulator [Euryarchaeota archaeon]